MIAPGKKTNNPSDVLSRNKARIMDIWAKKATSEIYAARGISKPALHDDLPRFLDQLALNLESKYKTPGKLIHEEEKRTEAAETHGRDRAFTREYQLQDVLHEYRILRQVILQVLEEDAPLSRDDRELILDSIGAAKEDAAAAFLEILREIKEETSLALSEDLGGLLAAAKTASLDLTSRDPNLIKKASLQIAEGMNRMESLIQDILDVGHIRAGDTLKLKLTAFDLTDSVRTIVAQFNATQPGRVRLSAEKEISGSWDSDGLKRVVEVLVENALKYGSPDSMVVVSLEESKGRINLNVHNVGSSISAEDQATLFEQFRRVKTPGKKEGSGLGLVLAKGIVEAHGGTIQVKSSAEHGTDFLVSIPVKAAIRKAG
ncbi:MAG: sensor histidine kinase [Bdellovibrionota bacterium]